MNFNREIHHRRSSRLPGYDYSQAGMYFVTICTNQKECLFGEIIDGEMRLNECGEIVGKRWNEIPLHYPNVKLDECVIMPNHVHGIIALENSRLVGAQHAAPLQNINVAPGSLGAIVRSFKSAVTKRINEIGSMTGITIWQRNYHEHIIRDEKSLNQIREYIVNNPAQWEMDNENPNYTPVGAQHAAPLQRTSFISNMELRNEK